MPTNTSPERAVGDPPVGRYFVVATYSDFLVWCREKGFNPRSPWIHHIGRESHLHGFIWNGDDRIVILAGWSGDGSLRGARNLVNYVNWLVRAYGVQLKVEAGS